MGKCNKYLMEIIHTASQNPRCDTTAKGPFQAHQWLQSNEPFHE